MSDPTVSAPGIAERLARMTPRQRALIELRLGRRTPAPESITPQPLGAGVFPLSFSQQRLWFLDQMSQAASASYNLSYAARLRGRLAPAMLGRAMLEVVRRHEALRTSIVERGGVPLQIVAAAGGVAVPRVDLAALPGARREAVARGLAAGLVERPFRLAQGPLLRALLVRLDAYEHLLVLVSPHIVADAWSLVVLLRDLTVAYQALLAGRPLPLAAPRIQFRDFAIWQRRFLSGDRLERESAYWRERLRGAPSFLDLPTDRPRPPDQGFRAGREPLTLSAGVVASLERLSLDRGCSLFMVLLGAFALLAGHHAGQSDVVVSGPVSYRDLCDCGDVVGFFANTLLFRIDLAGDPTFVELLARVRQVVVEAFDHQHLPVELVIKEAVPERSRSYPPLLQLGLNLVHRGIGGVSAQADLAAATGEIGSELTTEPFDLGIARAQTELGLVLAHDGAAIAGALHYRADIFDRATVAAMVAELCGLLERVARQPGVRSSELQRMWSERDRGRRLAAHAEMERSLAGSFKRRRLAGGR